jgi:hypothetical protein
LLTPQAVPDHEDLIVRAEVHSSVSCSDVGLTLEGPVGGCIVDAVSQRSIRVLCGEDNDVSPGHVLIRAYDNAKCSAPGLLQMAPVGALNAAIQIPGDACGIFAPQNSRNRRMMHIRAHCEPRTTTSGTTTQTTTTLTPAMLTTTTIGLIETAPSSDDGDRASIIIVVATLCMFLWMFIILVILRYRRNTKSLERARNMVLGTHGDLTFGAPTPLRRGNVVMNDLFAGGEIDPDTGEMTLFGGSPGPEVGGDGGGGGNMIADLWGSGAGAMPAAWGGVKGNPLFNATSDGSNSQSDGYLTANPDSIDGDDDLGDLDNFEEADFESFADSLLAESEEAFEQELFGSAGPSRARQQGNAQRDSLAASDGAWGGLANNLASAGIQIELDDLSDFENSDMEADDSFDDDDSLDDFDGAVPVVANLTYGNIGASVSTPNVHQGPGTAGNANAVWAAFAGRTSTYMGGDGI